MFIASTSAGAAASATALGMGGASASRASSVAMRVASERRLSATVAADTFIAVLPNARCVNNGHRVVVFSLRSYILGFIAPVRHWGRTSDILTIRFTSEIAAPAAAVWDIIRDGSRRAELDELLDKS